MSIRRAAPSEAAALSDLAFRSKASWGYDQAFMEACRGMLKIDEASIERDLAFVWVDDGERIAFYKIAGQPPNGILADFWLAPNEQRRGRGRQLFEHALAEARGAGYEKLLIESDPNAEGFYHAMGAAFVGHKASPVSPERKLPVLEIRTADIL